MRANAGGVLVTGATGFVGRALLRGLVTAGEYNVRTFVRAAAREPLDQPLPAGVGSVSGVGSVFSGEVGPTTDWSQALDGVHCIIHCAGRAHVMHETEADALAAYRRVNVDGTRRLAEQAALFGVRRLVFLSSIKVNGEETAPGSAFGPHDLPQPEDSYGLSKWEAEQVLGRVASDTGLEVVVVRSPLVYGPGVKGNLLRLLGLVSRGVPLPIGRVRNQRSMVGLDNLVDLLIRCIDHPAAAGETFLVADGEDLSTPELVRQLAQAMGRSPRLIPVPVSWLQAAGRLTGKAAQVSRLVASLQVDATRTREVLGWVPPLSVAAGLRGTVKAYLVQP